VGANKLTIKLNKKKVLESLIELNKIQLDKETGLLISVPVLHFENEESVFNNGPTKFTLNKTVFENMIENFNEQATGQDAPCNLDHLGGKSYGWIKQLRLNDEGNVLLMDIEMTPEGQRMLLEKEYRYFSAEFAHKFTRPDTNESFQNVFLGVALTNEPFFPQTELPSKLNKTKGEKIMNKDEMVVALKKEHDIDVVSLRSQNKELNSEIASQKISLEKVNSEKIELEKKLTAIELDKKEKEVDSLFCETVRLGKATKAQEKMFKVFLNTFEKMEDAKKEIEAMPVIVKLDTSSGVATDDNTSDDDSYAVKLHKLSKKIELDEKISFDSALAKAQKQLGGQ